MKVYEDFKTAVSGGQVYCPSCGLPNASNSETCSECGAALVHPVSLFQNFVEVLVQPLVGMRRVALTAPVLGSLMVVLISATIQYTLESFGLLQELSFYYNNPTKIPSEVTKAIVDNSFPSSPIQLLPLFALSVFSWLFVAFGLQLIGRFFFKNYGHYSYNPLLAVVGFSRVIYLGQLLLFFLLQAAVPYLGDVAILLYLIVPLLWQLALMVTGVRSSTGLNWTRSAIIVAITALFVLIFLPGLIGLRLPL